MLKYILNRIINKKSDSTCINQKITHLTKSYEKNNIILKKIFNNDDTIKYREIKSKSDASPKISVIFAEGMSHNEYSSDSILKPLQESFFKKSDSIDLIVNNILETLNVETSKSIDNIVGSILYGDTVLIVGNSDEGIIIDSKGWSSRTIGEPTSENVVRGPREGFVESFLINISLIRRKILNPSLKFRFREIGVETKTKICICYIENIADEKIVNELNIRLDKINIDSILDSGYIEELIKDSPLSPFATIGYTERPDKVAGNLLEGRIAIIVDGTPIVLTLPYVFLEYFQASEDYYGDFLSSSINRSLRWIAFFLSTSTPSLYVAMTTFHQEMIPTPLLLSIAAARDGVPFSTIIEIILMLMAFEILREGGSRLPAPIGTSVTFVGALVLGEAAVTARIVSAPIVIIVALTGLSNFLIPKMIGSLNIVRFSFLFLSALLGLYGYIFGVIGLSIHLMSMRSFGIPYMLNIGSIKFQDIKDTAIRVPWWLMDYRPKLIAQKNSIRVKTKKQK